MAWKRRSTSVSAGVEVELDEFNSDQLLQALIDDGLLFEGEAEAILARGKARNGGNVLQHGNQTGDELDRAMIALRRKNRSDALYYIERHLGREWEGLLQ